MYPSIAFIMPVIVMPIMIGVGIDTGGVYAWFTVIWVFSVVPILDFVCGEKDKNPDAEQEQKLLKSVGYRVVVWAWAPVQLAVIISALAYITAPDRGIFEIIGMTLSVGVLTGAVGITWAHELCHSPHKFERALAEIILASVTYSHFMIEHVYGHHKNVATYDDPASARYNESFYQFYFRSLIFSYVSAWNIESKRMAKQGHSKWNYRNRMLRYLLTSIVIYMLTASVFGALGIIFLIAQSVIAFSLLEIINYLEHYGLERKKLENGRYESVQPHHSWNSNHVMTNVNLINLGRHSDHHYRASRPYQVLRHFDNTPQLPYGYATMILMALVPPLWFKVMNPRVKEWRDKDI